MTEITLERVVSVVESFVTRTRGRPAAPLGADTALMREGHVDSFGMAELTAHVESELGLQLEAGSLIPEDFETPRVLYERIRELLA